MPPNNTTEHDELMTMKHRDIVSLGAEEINKPNDKPCGRKTPEGCLDYPTRPVLCKSYYCHGRLWRKKDESS
jgi:hypothetical protein